MRYVYIIGLLLLLSIISFAQENDTTKIESEFQTIFGKPGEKTKVSGFGTFSMDFMNVDKNFGLYMGAEGAVLINNRFYIGFYGRALTTMPLYTNTYYVDSLSKNVNIDRRLVFGHGGLLVGYVFSPEKPIHFGFNTKFGMGGLALVEDFYAQDNRNKSHYYYEDNSVYFHPVYVVTPQVDVEMNITYWFKFKLSVGYQFVSSQSINYKVIENGTVVEKELFNTKSLSSPSVSMGFVFGWFK